MRALNISIGRANQVAYRIDTRDGGLQLLVDYHGAVVVNGDAERLDRQPGPRPFAKRLKHEIRRDFSEPAGVFASMRETRPAASPIMADTVAPSMISMPCSRMRSMT